MIGQVLFSITAIGLLGCIFAIMIYAIYVSLVKREIPLFTGIFGIIALLMVASIILMEFGI
jgi:hypothetical protein